MRMIFVWYLVVKVKTSYNILTRRPMMNALGAIVFTPHLVMKFPSSAQQIPQCSHHSNLDKKKGKHHDEC
ncbi:hypothetical protein CR513_61026, partial [Mucuna pruriens]